MRIAKRMLKTFKLTGLENNAMLQLLYILAFTILALIAVSNLIRNLLMFSGDREIGIIHRRRQWQTEAPIPHLV